jgi:tetratricopeptide (TPR) repeat protein
VRICPTCGEENADRARFCQNCATPLTETERPSEVRKVVTIVFADVTGFRAGVEQWGALGETGFNSTMTALLASALCDLGRFEEAEANAHRSRELSADDDFASQAAWRTAQARVLSHRGEHDEALRLADEALAINESTDYLTWQGESDEVRGMVLAAAARTDEALEAYGRAIERLERKGVVPAVERVRARIAELLGE